MLEGLPLPVQFGAAGLGWILFGGLAWLVTRKIMAGDLIGPRERDGLVDRATKAESANEKLVNQNGQLMDMARLGTATWQALRKAAESDE